MSTLHNTAARLAAWARRHTLLLAAFAVTLAFVGAVFTSTFRAYDERQERIAAIEALAKENKRLGEVNAEQDREQCEGINGVNEMVRFVFDSQLRLRAQNPDAPPIPPELKQVYVELYTKVPLTDCATGAKTFFDPPFPPERTAS